MHCPLLLIDEGFKALYCVTRTIEDGGKRVKMLFCCYRTGTNKLVHLERTLEPGGALQYPPYYWDYVFHTSDDDPPVASDVDSEFHALMERIYRLTETQGSPEWHQGRMFQLSGTTALRPVKIFAAAGRIVTASEVSLLQSLGIPHEPPPPVDAPEDDILFTEESLKQLTKPTIEVLPILQEFPYPQ